MQNNFPGLNPHTINDLIPGVQEALQYKQNITSKQISFWLRKAILNITESYAFEELRREGPLVNIGPGLGVNGSNYAYEISYFLNPGDDYTQMEDPVIFLSQIQYQSVGLIGTVTTGTGYMGSSSYVGYPMDYLTPKAIQPILFIPGGVPFKYTRYGQQFWFGTQPGQNYQVYLPYQARHQFAEGDLLSSQLYFPTSWEMVMEYAAAIIGAHANRWPDMVTNLRNVLYGDPKGNGEPGLIKALLPQFARDKMLSTVQFMPQLARY